MDTLEYIFSHILISSFYILVGLLFDRWVSKKGYAQSSKIVVVFASIFLVFVKPFLFDSVSWEIYSIMVLIGVTLLVHQFDLRESMRHGAWWWKQEDKKKSKKR